MAAKQWQIVNAAGTFGCPLSKRRGQFTSKKEKHVSVRESKFLTHFQGSCYSVHFNRSSFTDAQAMCKSQDKTLVEISDQEENDLLSELLIQNEYSPGLLSQIWTGGVGSQTQRSALYYWDGSRTEIKSNFFFRAVQLVF